MTHAAARHNMGSLIYFVLAFALGTYFTFAAVQGDYGVFRRVAIAAEADVLRAERDKLMAELAEEFRLYSQRGGQVLVSTHSPDFLNATRLEEVCWLVKQDGYTQIRRACDDAQISAYMAEGDQMGYLWKQGFFAGADPV